MHLFFCFCIAKGLATFRLGGVISAQKSAILNPFECFCVLIMSIMPIEVFKSSYFHLCRLEGIFGCFTGFCVLWELNIETHAEP